MSTELNFLNYILLHWSLQQILLLLLLKIGLGLHWQYTLHKPLGDCLNCLIRKGKWRETPVSICPDRVVYIYLPISPTGR